MVVINSWIRNDKHFNVTLIEYVENKGICKSLNECLTLSSGKYVQLLALDDLLMPWKFEKHVEMLESNRCTDALAFSDALLIDENTNYYQNRFIAYHRSFLSLN